MTRDWSSERSAAETSRAARSRRALNDARPGERGDITIAGLSAIALAALLAIGWLVGGVLDRNALADPRVLQPLPDPRILSNMRDSYAPFVAGTPLERNDVALLRADGRMTYVDQHTGLISDDLYPVGPGGLSTAPVAMTASCADLPASSETCDDPEALSVLSEGGGLIRGVREGSRMSWQMLLHDSPWIGKNGTPVNQDEVTSWAAATGDRTVVLAGKQGLAIHDGRSGRWIVPTGQTPLLAAVSSGSARLVADGDITWVISDRGYGQVVNATLRWSRDTDIAVTDLTVSPEGHRLAIVTGPCQDSAQQGCLTVSRLNDMDDTVPMVGERSRIDDLDQSTLTHAMMQGGAIVTIGAAGIHAYDPETRSWRTIVSGRIDTFFPASDGRILAASGGNVYLVEEGEVRWSGTVDGGPFRQLVLADTLSLGLGEDGAIRNLTNNTLLAGVEEPLAPNAHFTAGASIGSQVLMAGPSGVLLHDVEKRRFNWLDPLELVRAGVLLKHGVRIFPLSNSFVAVEPARGRIHNIAISGDWPDQVVTTEQATRTLRGPLRSTTSNGTVLSLVDATGRPWQYPGDLNPVLLMGAEMPDLGGAPRFMTGNERGLFLASREAVALYLNADRGWTGPEMPPEGSAFADLSLSTTLFSATDNGTVHSLLDTGWNEVLGGTRAAIGSQSLTDTATQGQQILLAGAGQVQVYDPVSSEFTRHYDGGSGNVRIVDAHTGTGPRVAPIWVSGGKFLWGTEEVATDVRDAWRVSDGYIAERRGGANGSYIAYFPQISAAPTCSHFTAPAPRGTVRDGLALGPNRMLIATTQGFGIHEAENHRWVDLSLPPLGPDERLVFANDALVALAPNGFRALPLADIAPSDSCDAPTKQADWQERASGISAAFDPATGSISILEADGSISQWQNFASRPVQLSPGVAPEPSSFRAVAQERNNFLFATRDGVWTYDTLNRTWSLSRFTRDFGEIASIGFADVTPATTRLSIWTADGRSLRADYTAPDGDLVVKELRPIATPQIPLDPSAMSDFSMRDDVLAFGTRDQIAFGKRTATRLATTLFLTEGERATPFDWGDSLAFLSGQPDAVEHITIMPPETRPEDLGGRSRQLGFRYAPGTDRSYGLSSDDGTLWRIDASGALLSCDIERGGSAAFGCTEALPRPLEIDPERVSAGWIQSDTQYIGIGEDLYTIDENWRSLTPVEGPRVTDRSIRVRLRVGTLHLDQPGGDLWHITARTARKVATDVTKLADVDDLIAVQTQGHLALLDSEGNVADHPMPEDALVISLDWTRGRFAAISTQGILLDERGNPTTTVPLPSPETISAIVRDTDDRVFVQRTNGIVELLELAECDAGPHGSAKIPCFSRGNRRAIRDRDLGRLDGIERDEMSTTLVFESGLIRLNRDFSLSNPEQPVSDTRPLFNIRGGRPPDDTTGDFRRAIVSLAGRHELAPARITDTQLSARNLMVDLAPNPRAWAPMTLDWMRWERTTGQFLFNGSGGDVALSPVDAIIDGRIIASRPGRAMPLAASHIGSDYAWRTDEALWHYETGAQQPKLIAYGKRPRTDGQIGNLYLLRGGQAETSIDGNQAAGRGQLTLTAGDLTLSADGRRQAVSAMLSRIGGPDVNAFASVGFAHDQRVGLGYVDGRIMTITPVGLIPPPGPLTGAEILPAGRLPARIVSDRGVHAEMSRGSWLVRSGPGTWAAVGSPLLPRNLGTTGGREWKMTGEGLAINAAEPWQLERDGLNFASDRLLSVAGTPEQVVVATALGTHMAPGGANLAQLGAPIAPVPALPLVTYAARPDRSSVYESSGQRRRWDGAAWVSVVGTPPWIDREGAVTPAMRIDLVDGTFRATRKVISPDGAVRWFGFDWTRGQRFPFDVARHIVATPEALWIGTDMGLRRFGASGQPSSDLHEVSAGTGQPGVIIRLGRPEQAPDRVRAMTASGACAEVSGSGLAASCPTGETLARRFVLSSSLWNWVQTDAGPLGVYTALDAGQARQLPVRMGSNNRWPHDDLSALADCGPGYSELWSSGDVLRQNGTSIVLPISTGTDLHCQATASELGGGQQLAPGLYVLGTQPLLSGANHALQPVPPTVTRELEARARGDIVYDAGRLRLRVGAADGNWEHRTAADEWRAMDWDQDLPAIDRSRGISVLDGKLVRITPGGLVTQEIQTTGLTIAPDQFMPGVADRFGSLATCHPERIDNSDGSQHAIAPRSADRVLIQCRDGDRLMGEPKRTDIGALKAAPAELFEGRTLIDDAGWLWTSKQNDPTKSSTVAATFQGENMPVTAGRFPVDSFVAIAAPFRRGVELVTVDGWRRFDYPLGLRNGSRPAGEPGAETITAVTTDRMDEPVLCTEGSNGAILRSEQAAIRRAEECMRWQGRAGVWSYRDRTENTPVATALAENGPLMHREISEGRFLDLFAIGNARAVGQDLVVPTRQGSLTMTRAGEIRAYHQFENTRGLYLDEAGKPVAITADRREPLDIQLASPGECRPLDEILGAGNARLTSVDTFDGLLHASLYAPDEAAPSAMTFDCTGSFAELQRRDLTVTERARYQAQMRALDQSTGRIRLQGGAEGRLIVSDGRSRSTELRLQGKPGDLLGIYPAADGRTILALFEREVFQLDVDAALSRLAAVSPAAPPSVDPQPETPTRKLSGTQSKPAPATKPQPTPDTTPPGDTTQRAPAAPSEPAPPQTEPASAPEIDIELPFASLDRAEVIEIQTALRKHGFYVMAVDGLPGPGTRRAVRAFQSRIGAPETGVLTERQRRLLLEGSF